jgi:hypothetical protein
MWIGARQSTPRSLAADESNPNRIGLQVDALHAHEQIAQRFVLTGAKPAAEFTIEQPVDLIRRDPPDRAGRSRYRPALLQRRGDVVAVNLGLAPVGEAWRHRLAERHDLQPARLAADTAYGSAEMLDWLVNKRRIAPHIPVIDKSGRDDGTFARSDFTYDPGADSYRCPAGKTLKRNRRAFREPRPNAPPDDTYRYRAAKADCDACPMKDRCRPSTLRPAWAG